MCKIVCGKDIDEVAWARLVEESPVATWFQTIEAYTFFDSLSFLEAFAFGIERSGMLKGVVVGFIQMDGGKLKQFFSRRAIINGGPLLAEDITEEELTALLSNIVSKLRRKAIFIESRNYNDYSRWLSAFMQSDFYYEAHYDVHIDTSSLDIVNSRLDRNRKRNIKKAKDNGILIDTNPDESEIKDFYGLLSGLYASKVKVPLFPYDFFKKLRALPSSRFFIAKNKSNEVIGGLVCVALYKKAIYAWMACGEDSLYKELFPSVMVNYAGICYSAENGYPRFDFMGAGSPDDGGYGVRDFKLKFGGDLVEYGRFKYLCNSVLYSIGKTGVKLLKRRR